MEQGSTIHSVLKPLKNRPGFYYDKDNLLKTDVLIIDEASMIDISLLTRLLEAVPEKARVILLGDKNQLSSIQAGSVFSDICNAKSLSSLLFVLEYNFRSKGKTGIENLSKAVNENDGHNSGEYGTLPLNHICEKILRTGNNFDIQEKFFKTIKTAMSVDLKRNSGITKCLDRSAACCHAY